jgi:hypothetical protein
MKMDLPIGGRSMRLSDPSAEGMAICIVTDCSLLLHGYGPDRGILATNGPYDYVRHPQHVGFILVLTGFLVQWPTLLTLAMFAVLVAMYVWLARQEEAENRAVFGQA